MIYEYMNWVGSFKIESNGINLTFDYRFCIGLYLPNLICIMYIKNISFIIGCSKTAKKFVKLPLQSIIIYV